MRTAQKTPIRGVQTWDCQPDQRSDAKLRFSAERDQAE
jgi:hypothetical protein